MSDPVITIRRGLDQMAKAGARSTENINPADLLGSLIGLDVSLNNLKTHRAATKAVRDSLLRVRVDSGAERDRERAKVERQFADLGIVIDENGRKQDDLGADRRKVMRDRALTKALKVLTEKYAEKTTEARLAIKKQRELLDQLEAAWGSPLQVLNRMTLKSADRALYAQNLAGAGPATINEAMAVAIRNTDRPLAYACCAAIDGLNKDQKKSLTFTREEVAAAVTFEEMSVAAEQLGMARYLLEVSDLIADEAEGKRIDPSRKIRVGKIRMELAASLGKQESDLDDDPALSVTKQETSDAA